MNIMCNYIYIYIYIYIYCTQFLECIKNPPTSVIPSDQCHSLRPVSLPRTSVIPSDQCHCLGPVSFPHTSGVQRSCNTRGQHPDCMLLGLANIIRHVYIMNM